MDKSDSALKDSALPKGTVLKYGKKSYVIEKVLGDGGYGITYKAYSIEFDGNIKRKYYYAIKEYFQKGFWRDGKKVCYADSFKAEYNDGLDDFKAEANKLLSLVGKTRNIVPVNESFQQNNTMYYVMEFLNGKDLEKIVPKGEGISEAKALSLFVPIIKAVKILHDNKTGDRIMHLDIKPDNIVLHQDPISEETYPVLIDFGAAMRFNKAGKPKTRKANKGTTGFAPPEQFQPIEHFDARIDVYALGATLFYLLTGIQPKSSDDVSDSYIMESLPKNISERTRNTIKNAMQKDKDHRLRDAQEFLDALEDSYYLPVFSTLRSPNQAYKVLSVENENNYSITYKGCISYSLDSGLSYANDKNLTKASYEYFIHEYYVRSICKRTDTKGIMNLPPQTEESFQLFKSEMNNMGVSESIPCLKNENGIVEKETFAANGTYYYCTKINKKKAITPIPIDHLKRLAIAFLVIAVATFGIMNLYRVGDFFRGLIPTESEKLTEAIDKQDFNRLKKFAEKDSIRAYAPLAMVYITDKKDTLNAYQLYKKIPDKTALKEIEDALMKPYNENISTLLERYNKGDNSNKDDYLIKALEFSNKGKSIASRYDFIFNRLDLSTTVDKRFDEWVKAGDEQSFKIEIRISNYQHALNLKEDNNVREKLNELLKTQNSLISSQQQMQSPNTLSQTNVVTPTIVEMSDDQKFEVAIKNSNWAELKKLADKGYSKAYIPLAKQYLRSSSTHSEAEKYALKAVKISKQEVKNIIDLLDSFGYYDDKNKPSL